MDEHDDVTYERLLKMWGFRREMFNHYSRKLGMLLLDGTGPDAQQRELREKLIQATLALREASERLQFYEIAMP